MVELFGAIVNIHYATPSDEDIANFDGIPALQQQQQQPQPQPQPKPRPQSEVAAIQVNAMLDEQAANPRVAQAVIHEILQENAPIDDPIADTEAYHDAGIPKVVARDDATVATSSTGIDDQAEKGKGILDEGDKAVDFDDSSDSDSSDSDDEVGSKMVSVGGSSSSRKRREPIDLDYRSEEEEAPVTNQSKRAR